MSTQAGHASLIGASFGPYQVQALVGRGAMGTVYLARDTVLKRQVALKVLLGHLARNPLLVKRFHREAQATAHLRHSNIVRIYAAGVESGTPYIAMEFVDGEPLDRFLHRYGRLEWQRALHIGSQVAEALAAAHGVGIVHRDVKPANIMLDPQGRVRLTDFGIAHVHTDLDDHALEESFVGTPRYMSPEQCANRDISFKTDLFSLGIVLYETIAGSQPFQGESAVALIKRITHDEPPRLNKLFPEVPDDVARLVAHLLEKRPQDRPKDASDVVHRIAALHAENGGRSAMPDALTAFIRDQAKPRTLAQPVSTPPSSARHMAAPRRSRRTLHTRVALAAMILAVAAAAPQLWLRVGDAEANRAAMPVLDQTQAVAEENLRVFGVISVDMEVRALTWQSDARHVLVWTSGRLGSVMHGAEGVLRINTHTGRVESLLAPMSPVLAAEAARTDWARPFGYGPARVDEHSGELLMLARPRTGGEQILAYRADNGRPAREWSVEMRQEPDKPWRHGGRVLAWAAEGLRFCTTDGNGDATRLLEVELSPAGAVSTSRVVREKAGNVRAIGYARSGRGLAYVEENTSGEHWLFAMEGMSADSTKAVARVAPGSGFAFSPEGTRLAYTSADGEVRVYDSLRGQDVGYEPGILGHNAWHPSGAFFVAFAPGHAGDGLRQVDVGTPGRGRALREMPLIPAGAPTVSPDGSCIAVPAEAHGNIEIAVVRLDGHGTPRELARR